MITPTKRERLKGLTINYYEVKEVKFKKPKEIQVFLFDSINTGSFISQAEFMTCRAAAQEIDPPNFFVDDVAAWKILEVGGTIQVVIMGKKGKKKAIKLLQYLLKTYNLKFDNIILLFDDKDFVLDLINS